MAKSRWLRSAMIALLILTVLGPVSIADDGDPDDQEFAQIAFVLDGSQSIYAAQFDAVLHGLAQAIEQEIGYHPDRVGQVEISVVQFGLKPEDDPNQMRVEVNPVIVTADNRGQIRDRILAIEQGHGFTPTGDAIRLGTAQIVNSPNFGRPNNRRILNVITDGGPYDKVKYPDETSDNPVQAKQDALNAAAEARAAGIHELDTEGFGTIGAYSWVLPFFRELTYPQPAQQYGPGQPTPPAAPLPTPQVGQGFVYLLDNSYNLRPPVFQKLRDPFPTDTPTATPTNTATPTHTATYTPTNTYTPSPTGSATPTMTLTPTGTVEPTPTRTITPTKSPTPVAVPEGGSGLLLMLGLVVMLAYGGLKYARQQGGPRPF